MHNELRMVIGEHVIELASVESSNKTAAELIRLSKAGHGTVILAQEQTAGRGQRGRQWQSVPGRDLTFSLVLEPSELRAEAQFGLGKLAALALLDTVSPFFPGRIKVKWPNDLLVDRSKIAGILIECDLIGDMVHHAIIGVGLNVNSTDFPVEFAATSLSLETGKEHSTSEMLERLLLAFRQRYMQWSQDPDKVDLDYTSSLWSRGRWADMLLDGAPLALRPIDVDQHGRLLVEHEGGKVAAYGLDRLRFAQR